MGRRLAGRRLICCEDRRDVKIGIVCPYSWDIPGGVQAHVRDLAEALIAMGHAVSVLAPGDEDTPGLPDYVAVAGKTVAIPYNGSVARLQFGPMSAARVRRWLKDGDFDVVHVHEPAPPSLSLLTCMIADVPLVATFHAASNRSRFMAMFDTVLQTVLERLSGRIAVSQAARKMIVEHLGADAVVIPNGVAVSAYESALPLPGYPRDPALGGTVGFIGRFDETRKGMDVLLRSLELVVPSRPGLQLIVAGRGDEQKLRAELPRALIGSTVMLGIVSEADKASLLRSVDVYVAPNTGGESFGIILLEAMAAGTPIVASDLDAFRRVLDDGRAGILFRNGDEVDLARALELVLGDANLRGQLSQASAAVVRPYDWRVVARQVERVYEIAVTAGVPGAAPERRSRIQ
jgi:phosphatidylinositol alpha-mannosyltransferase